MPVQANHRKNRSKDRRNEVLDAARLLFFSKGYHGTTVEQIATNAGYSKRTVYLDFLNKDELFITVCAEGGERLFEKLNQIPREGISFEEAIDQFVRTYIQSSLWAQKRLGGGGGKPLHEPPQLPAETPLQNCVPVLRRPPNGLRFCCAAPTITSEAYRSGPPRQ